MKLARLIAQANLQTGSEPLDALQNVGGGAYSPVPGGYAETDIAVTVAKILNSIFGLLGIVFVVLFIYAGFLYMTAAGNESQVEKAMKIMRGAVIGLILILMSYGIAKFVITALKTATGTV